MPRQLFSDSSQHLLSVRPEERLTESRPQIEMLRQKRSPAYLQALITLDSGGHVVDSQFMEELRRAISDQFPDAGARPRGWVAICYLGPPFQVHILDLAGDIVRHFRFGEPMPEPFERARSLALHARYAFVEVHSDKLVAVAHDGATSVCAL